MQRTEDDNNTECNFLSFCSASVILLCEGEKWNLAGRYYSCWEHTLALHPPVTGRCFTLVAPSHLASLRASQLSYFFLQRVMEISKAKKNP